MQKNPYIGRFNDDVRLKIALYGNCFHSLLLWDVFLLHFGSFLDEFLFLVSIYIVPNKPHINHKTLLAKTLVFVSQQLSFTNPGDHSNRWIPRQNQLLTYVEIVDRRIR
ncbi:hypothetical protein L1887_39646 [Cichorium endivia]|nr:hypothetical protein L1887_39646 [Cichorium endivia]